MSRGGGGGGGGKCDIPGGNTSGCMVGINVDPATGGCCIGGGGGGGGTMLERSLVAGGLFTSASDGAPSESLPADFCDIPGGGGGGRCT